MGADEQFHVDAVSAAYWRVNFDNGPALEDELFYWIGMNFDPGAIGSFAWATSLDPQMTKIIIGPTRRP